MPVAAPDGAMAVTVPGVVSLLLPVVKVYVVGVAGKPFVSLMTVVTVTVYRVFAASGADGAMRTMVFPARRLRVAGIVLAPCRKVTVAAVTVAGSSGLLNW